MFTDPNLVLLFYVNDAAISEKFYSNLLGTQAIESSPNFSMFILKSGVNLGLWSKHDVEPAAAISGGGGELGLQVTANQQVDELHSLWKKQGIIIIQPPTEMDFGYTFVGLDPDQHRIRVYALK